MNDKTNPLPNDRQNQSAKLIYFLISFRGHPRQYGLYQKMKKHAQEGMKWLQESGSAKDLEDAAMLQNWMSMPGCGFTRPHMPYYVTLSQAEHRALSRALRRDQGTTPAYLMFRRYGRWVTTADARPAKVTSYVPRNPQKLHDV